MKTLSGHVSPETAYVVDDYPYGFRLRCKIRYWIETTKHGQRLVSQTTNPKRPGEVWNKPKASTYAPVMVLILDDEEHVQQAAVHGYDEASLDAFEAAHGPALGEYEQKQLKVLSAYARAAKRVTWTVTSGTAAEGPRQTAEEQKALMRAVVVDEYRKL